MKANRTLKTALCVLSTGWFACSALGADTEVEKQLQQLKESNDLLRQQLQKQQQTIDELSKKVSSIAEPEKESGKPLPQKEDVQAAPKSLGFQLGRVRFTGEGGAGFFRSGPAGIFPNSEFRIDEAKLFVEAPLWNDTYFFSELNLTQREDPGDALQLGELYVDFENVSRLWHQDKLVNLRIGRMDIPFGEEYLVRDSIDNPLITHSLSDIWGVDEGVELYGSSGKFSYVAAVQNGSHPSKADYNGDKSISARVSLDLLPSVHLSLSAMRTGALDTAGDQSSELWFGNGFIHPISVGTTSFHADVIEGDFQYRLPQGHLKAAGGWVSYGDNHVPHNRRDMYYYYLEATQKLTRHLYLAGRWSQIFAPNGSPIMANGNYYDYVLNNLTKSIWRLSLGAGWRFSDNLALKAEYMFENGKTTTGQSRSRENMFATEIVFRF
jgi:hypothetical protein